MDNKGFDENADLKRLIEEQKRIIENQAHEIDEKNRITQECMNTKSEHKK